MQTFESLQTSSANFLQIQTSKADIRECTNAKCRHSRVFKRQVQTSESLQTSSADIRESSNVKCRHPRVFKRQITVLFSDFFKLSRLIASYSTLECLHNTFVVEKKSQRIVLINVTYHQLFEGLSKILNNGDRTCCQNCV